MRSFKDWMGNWPKDSWERWDTFLKVLKIVAIAIAVIIVGGLIYETIAGRISRGSDATIIADLRADNKRIREGLVDAQDRVTVLDGTVEDVERGNRELGEQLTASEIIAGDLLAENKQLRRELEQSGRIADILRDENIKLGGALSESESSAGSIRDTSRELEDSIGRAWDIIDSYPIPTGSE